MIIVDKALEKLDRTGKPIRVGMMGAGFMAKGITLQMLQFSRGIRLVAIANRDTEKAKKAYLEAGAAEVAYAQTQAKLDRAIEANSYVVTDDPLLLARSPHIDILLEVTGTLEYAVPVILEAFKHGKHVAVMNAELDGTLGPILKTYADRAGVIYSNTDGDQPGVQMNLLRFVKGIGVTPLLSGNIKGLQDPYRTPLTQAGFAAKWGQKPHMVTSFADGTKISFEQAVVANAVGFQVAKQGMWGTTVPNGTPLAEAVKFYPAETILKSGGLVDYLVGAEPNPGVFVLGTMEHPVQKHYLNLYKLGEGPLYLFYTPYHLCHFEIPNTIGRICVFRDPVLTPLNKPCVEVAAVAKKDLHKDEIIDGMGHFMTYGECVNAQEARERNLLPIGLAEGCRLTQDIKKDTTLTFNEVEIPQGRLIDTLWQEQRKFFKY
ncbi:MAG: NAD(P)-dependent oxidoreductase [Patescibacteria group bacterium]